VRVPKKVTPDKFRPIMLVSVYRYSRAGMPEASIIDALDISPPTWRAWKKKHPSIQEALAIGIKEHKESPTWHRYIYDRLPLDIREIWDRIESWDADKNGVAKIEALLEDHGKTVRQQLFLFALVQFNFSKSKACAKVCISKKTLDEWIKNDPEFASLVEEVQWHKGNFFEEALVRLVNANDPGLVKFANETFNKNRGYGKKVEHDHTHRGTIEHEHSLLDLTELELSPTCRDELHDAIRKHQEKIEAAKTKAITVEYTVRDRLADQISSIASTPELQTVGS
jgi:hypothetical protein